MTKLTKPVLRETHALMRGRPIVVKLHPPDLISFKEKGRRQWFTITVTGAFWTAMKVEADRVRREKLEARKNRKEKS